MLIVLAFVATTTPDVERAAPPAVQIAAPADATLADIEVVQTVGANHVRVAMTFTLSTESNVSRDLALTLDVPRDTAVVGMRLQLGENDARAALVWSEPARKVYNAIVERDRDPALLEWVATNDTHHQLQLRVFPVTTKTPATVTIMFVAPKPIVVKSTGFTIDQRFAVTARPCPTLGFGRQLGRKLSLIATDRNNHRRQ
ncbi:MAG: hypothetical protein M4D80_31940 [Myxococcota bacterium]|nr:hypothetical protein [Myxococcota bacterium]